MPAATREQPPLILGLGTVHPAGQAILEPAYEVREIGPLSEGDFPPELQEAVAVIVRGDGGFTAAQIAAAPRLRVIGRTGAGLDNVDLDAAAAAGVTVVYAPAMNVSAVAELTVGLFLSLGRLLPELNAELRRGNWQARDAVLGTELRGATVGIVGLGRIGRAVAALCHGFGATVQAHDPYAADGPEAGGPTVPVAMLPLDQLLTSSDYVSLHAPLTGETAGLIDARRLVQMKRGAVLVNVARGGLTPDLDALLTALNDQRIRGVALDVFSSEPPSTLHPLFNHPRCLVTPHVGGLSTQAVEAVFQSIAGDIRAVLEGRAPVHPVR